MSKSKGGQPFPVVHFNNREGRGWFADVTGRIGKYVNKPQNQGTVFFELFSKKKISNKPHTLRKLVLIPSPTKEEEASSVPLEIKGLNEQAKMIRYNGLRLVKTVKK